MSTVAISEVLETSEEVEAESPGTPNSWIRNEDPYILRPNGISKVTFLASGKRRISELSNFAVEIAAEVERDDGTEKTRWFNLVLARPGVQERTLTVSAASFHNGTWVEHLAANEVVHPHCKDQLRAAIQLLSKDCEHHTVYTHVGWRKLSGEWVYLHGGGGIGARGVVESVTVDLDTLRRYVLPGPPQGDELQRVLTASLDLVNYGPDRIVFPGLAAMARAPLGNTNRALFFTGSTENGKSTWAAILQAHFGAEFVSETLPANWDTDTANSLLELAHRTKDAILVIDEFVPWKAKDERALRTKADIVLRSVANGAARHRSHVDGTLRPDKPPRTFVIGTGEDAPEGQSLRARMVIVHIDKDELHDRAQLDKAQAHARNGDYAAAMSAYVQWLAPQMETMPEERRKKVAGYRKLFEQGAGHRRSPDAAAELLFGYQMFLRFASEVGAIGPIDAADLLDRCVNALQQGVRTQATDIKDSDPVHLFLQGVNECLGTKRAHLVSRTGDAPDNAAFLGWRDDNLMGVKVACGPMIGVVDGNDLWLSPTVAVGAVRDLYLRAGQTFGSSTKALGRALAEKRILKSTAKDGGPAVRNNIGGRDSTWWHIDISVLNPHDPDDDDPNSEPISTEGPVADDQVIQQS